MSTNKSEADEIKYSPRIPGDEKNYHWAVQFDITSDGYLGISQSEQRFAKESYVKDWLLLSPEQVKALLKFLDAK